MGNELKVEYKDIEELVPYTNNPRDNNEKAVDAVVSSIKEFGFKNPIIIDKSNIIIASHTRLLAARKLGLQTVPTIEVKDLTDKQVRAYRIADNKTNEFAEWDMELLAIETEDLDDLFTGFDNFSPDMFGEEFTLDSGEKSNFEQITFTLSSDQAETIREALKEIDADSYSIDGNDNKNGNAIYGVVVEWLAQKI